MTKCEMRGYLSSMTLHVNVREELLIVRRRTLLQKHIRMQTQTVFKHSCDPTRLSPTLKVKLEEYSQHPKNVTDLSLSKGIFYFFLGHFLHSLHSTSNSVKNAICNGEPNAELGH